MKKAQEFGGGFGIVLGAALLMFFVKMFVSYHVYGTNDISSWIQLASFIKKFGSFKVYAQTDYNHSPLVLWALSLIMLAHQKTGLSFAYLFRIMPITADFLSMILLWKLLEKYAVPRKALLCLICIFSPVNFLIAAFHGQIDPVMICLLLLVFNLLEEGRVLGAGFAYGLSICVKIVPLIFIPVFFYFLKTKKQKMDFFLVAFLVLLSIFLPYLIKDGHSLTKNVLGYSSYAGLWGIGHLHAILKWYTPWFKIIFFAILIGLICWLTLFRKLNLLELGLLTFALFFILTPGFGVQYLSWVSYFAIIVLPLSGSIFTLLGGVFLYRVYVFWGGGQAPYYANSVPIGKWHGYNFILDVLLWSLVVIMLVSFIYEVTCLTIKK